MIKLSGPGIQAIETISRSNPDVSIFISENSRDPVGVDGVTVGIGVTILGKSHLCWIEFKKPGAQ